MGLGKLGYFVTRASGYAVCEHFDGALSDAIAVINAPTEIEKKQQAALKKRQVAEQKLLVEQMGASCKGTNLDLDSLENIGNGYCRLERYSEAMECFVHVYQKDKAAAQKVEVYTKAGLMYELGLGVAKSMENAYFWYKRAGLL